MEGMGVHQQNRIAGIFVGLIAIAIVFNVFFIYNYFSLLHQAQRIAKVTAQVQQDLSKVNRNVMIMQRLGIDALRYATEHPNSELRSILSKHVPLLQRLHLLVPKQTNTPR